MLNEDLVAHFDFDTDESGKHGSLTNIFSCWNGMVGSGLVTVPWAFNESGIVLGVLLTILAFVISFTTQYYVMKCAGADMDYSDTLKKTFGKKGWYLGMILFIIMLFIPIIIFFMLLSQYLYPILLVIIELFTKEDRKLSFDTDFSQFSYSYTCMIVFLFLFILTMRRDMSLFIKINSFGVIFTIIIIGSIVVIGIIGLSTSEYEYVAYNDNKAGMPLPSDANASVILIFASQFNHLVGILGGGFYLHNISLPIYRNSKKPENNVRDIFIGFLVVCLSYIVCGVLGTYGFTSKHMFGPDVKIEENFLNQFDPKNLFAIFMRCCCFCQLVASMCLMFSCQRGNILMLTTGSNEAKTDIINMCLNSAILIPPMALAIFYPQVGKVAGILGAVGGLLCIYFLPTFTYLAQKRQEINNPALVEALRTNQFTLSPPKAQHRRKIGKKSELNSPNNSKSIDMSRDSMGMDFEKLLSSPKIGIRMDEQSCYELGQTEILTETRYSSSPPILLENDNFGSQNEL
jgi:sodium-coupled neutral amino acid transporter 9